MLPKTDPLLPSLAFEEDWNAVCNHGKSLSQNQKEEVGEVDSFIF